jgi:hypothetical protein
MFSRQAIVVGDEEIDAGRGGTRKLYGVGCLDAAVGTDRRITRRTRRIERKDCGNLSDRGFRDREPPILAQSVDRRVVLAPTRVRTNRASGGTFPECDHGPVRSYRLRVLGGMGRHGGRAVVGTGGFEQHPISAAIGRAVCDAMDR